VTVTPPPPTSYAELARDILRVARLRRTRAHILSAVLGISPPALARLAAHPAIYGGSADHLDGWLRRWADYCAALPPIKNGRPASMPFGETAGWWRDRCGEWRDTLIAECRREPLDVEAVDAAATDLASGLEVLEMCGGGA